MTTDEDKRTKDKRTIALQKDINALLKEQRDIKEELADSAGEYNKEITKALSISQKLLVTSAERKQMALEEVSENQKIEQQKLELANSIREEMEKRISLLTIEGGMNTEELEKLTKKLDLATKNQEIAKENLDTLKDQASSIQAQKTISEKSVGAFSSIAGSLGIARSETADMVKGMAFAYIEAVKTDGVFKGTLKTIGSLAMAFWDVFNPVSIISSLMEKIMTASIEFMHTSSAALANFSKSAGDAGAMASDVSGAMNLGTGVNITEVAQAASGLAGSWNEMSDAASSTRRMVIRTGAELERMGWSAEAYGKSITYMQSALGMSAEEGAKAMKGLASAAHGLGMSQTEMASNFSSLQADLALYGGRITDKFLEIAAAAKEAGIEMSDVVALGSKFDTFSGAADTVGQLNSYLGGPMLNSLEMFHLQAEKGPVAVQEAVVSALRASGKTFLDMSNAEKLAFAETLDMKVDAFGSLMGYQSEEAKAKEKAAKTEAKQQKRYQKMLRSTISLAEQIQYFFQSVFAHPAVISALKDFFEVLYGKDTKEGLGAVTKLIGGGMAIAIRIATKVLERLTKLFNDKFGPMLKDASGGVDGVGGSFEKLEIVAGDAADWIIEKFKGIFDAVEEVALVFSGEKSFWDTAFGDWLQEVALYATGFAIAIGLIAWALVASSGPITAAFIAMGTGGLVLIPVLLTAALAFAAIALAFYGLAQAIKEMAGLFDSLAGVFISIGVAINTLGKFIADIFTLVLEQGIIKSAKIGAFIVDLGFSVGKFAKQVNKINFKKLKALNEFIVLMKTNIPTAAAGLTKMATAANRLSRALRRMPTGKLGSFGWNVTSIFNAVGKIKPTAVGNATTIIQEAIKYQTEVAKNSDNTDALAALLTATSGQSGGTAGAGQPINITLELGGRVLDKYIYDSVNGALAKI